MARVLPQAEPDAPTLESCPSCSKISAERDKLQNALQKFTNGSEMLNIILMNQRAYRDKTGLGYKPRGKKWVEPKVKLYLKFFHRATEHSSTPCSLCNYCNRKGHSTSTCNAKKHGANNSYKWVPKGTKATKDPPPRKETKGGQGSRAWKQSTRKAQVPRANNRPKAQINHKPKVKTNTGPRALGTNNRGPNKSWIPKLVWFLQVCLKASKNKKWYIDSGCWRHMTGDRDKFKSLVIKDGATVTFGGNQSGKITGVGEVI